MFYPYSLGKKYCTITVSHGSNTSVLLTTLYSSLCALRTLFYPCESNISCTLKVGDSTVSSRIQIPLRLAWALSVHKSQGMTIPNLTVSLRGVFEYGQAYVALSRATEMKLLTLKDFNERAFRAHPKVKHFYALLGGQREDEKTTGKQAHRKYAHGALNHSDTGTKQMGKLASALQAGVLTDDQRRRMEENRRRALELKKKRLKVSSAAPTTTTSETVSSSEVSRTSSNSKYR